MNAKNVAKTIVVNSKGQILLLRRSKTDPRRPGEWDFPGGGLEDGEGFAEAARRELSEEAGLQVALSDLIVIFAGTEYYEPADEGINRVLFSTFIDDTTQQLHLSFEHDDATWVSPEQAIIDFPHTFYTAGLQYALEHDLLPKQQ